MLIDLEKFYPKNKRKMFNVLKIDLEKIYPKNVSFADLF